MQLFHFWSRYVHLVQNLLMCTKFHENPMIFTERAIYRFSNGGRPPSWNFYHHKRPPTKSASSSASICHWRLFSFVSGVTHPLETRPWKLRPGRAASLSTATAPVCPQRCGSSSLVVWCFGFAIIHWLRVAQRLDFKIAVMAFRVLHGLAPPYLDQLVRVADLPGRRTRSLCSSTSHQLDIPAYRPSIVSGRRINSVEHSTIWDSVVTFADSVSSTTEDVYISRIIPWCPILMTTFPWTSQ